MGMAASQARFLGLTARKNNVEYEGQQINQQRTALSNQSASYYTNLLGMNVPKPPVVQDFTKTIYSFTDGTLSNQLTSLVAHADGSYTMSYLRNYMDNEAITAAVPARITRSEVAAAAPADVTPTPVTPTVLPTHMLSLAGGTIPAYFVETDDDGNSYYSFDVKMDDGSKVTQYIKESDGAIAQGNSLDAEGWLELEGATIAEITEEELEAWKEENTEAAPSQGSSTEGENWEYKIANQKLRELGTGLGFYEDETWHDLYVKDGKVYTDKACENEYEGTELAFDSEDEYIKSLSPQQWVALIQDELAYKARLNADYSQRGDDTWLTRYVKNTSTGAYVPSFYNKSVLDGATYDETSTSVSYIGAYTKGAAEVSEEIKGVKAYLEQDSTGRYINITMEDPLGNMVTYALTTSTVTDDAAYNDAMNQYEFDKAKYDQDVAEINAKIEVIQCEDKDLEIRLKQLDTEQDAISNEMDAVTKVIEKNVESSFKTFG